MRLIISSFLLSLMAAVLVASISQAAEKCESVFETSPYHEAVLEAALGKAITKRGKVKGLSSKDLDLLIERVFNKKEGKAHKVSAYWKLNSEKRAALVLERKISEQVAKQGILKYFEDNGLLVDKSRLYTKLVFLNRSRTFNGISAVWSIFAMAKGAPPVLLPEMKFAVKEADLNTLLLKGKDSVEGQEILQRYRLKLEANRGYDLFSRYYTRVALGVLMYIVYEQTRAKLDGQSEEESAQAFDEMMKRLNESLESRSETESKEDVLFDTVIANFREKYDRLPDGEETRLICVKVYGPEGCP
ncbi:hypothetical protein QJS83_00820 [Bdellovibrio sp. 22V]|uniref:hypothetical protein n=1 Tax=Bdellovibrio sp. 22V TaxID=3044166 RepID=UPI002543634F|nr:hypothetical protein [Bdellovibrio sp. 22V]WII72408.1 hypothetical protein QJS83_00820 [Bdellovibrio sp. 22V]